MEKRKEILMPLYTRGEEIFNMTSHIVGGVFGLGALIVSLIVTAIHCDPWGIVSAVIYGVTMILLYTFSSIYHGLRVSRAKKVFRVIDHCTIYLLIAGSYTPIALCALRPAYPTVAWIMFGVVWGSAILAITLTAINMQKFKVFSMIAYLAMGWCVIFYFRQTWEALGSGGMSLLAVGGVLYTVGAVLYVIGKKKKTKYMHSVFHLFVLAGSITQFFAILFYAFC